MIWAGTQKSLYILYLVWMLLLIHLNLMDEVQSQHFLGFFSGKNVRNNGKAFLKAEKRCK